MMLRVFVTGLLLVSACSDIAAAPTASKPNFLVIVADDMGFSDAGCYGGEIHTPNLDRLAANGLRFTQFYNTARCWPSRAAILTGYYAQQVRRDALPGLGGGAGGKRPAWARLLPEYLKPLGYRSYHSGKWHVDGPVLEGGFERSYSLNDHDRNFNPKSHTLDDKPLPPVEPGSGYYTTTAIAGRAIDMLSAHQAQHAGEPFFVYLAFTVPHFPLHALPEDIALYTNRYRAGWDALRQERYARIKSLGLAQCALPALEPDVFPNWNPTPERLTEQIGPGEVARAVPWDRLTSEQKTFQPIKMALHAAMVHRMDIEIGRVLDKIRNMGAWENTVVMFVSDNGASAEQLIRGDRHDPAAPPGSAKTFLSIGPGWSSAANTPFRLHKSWVHEGGICTPFIVEWPKGISDRGALRQNPGHLVDLAPTILELAGGKMPEVFGKEPMPPLPGKSLVPALAKDNTVAHEYFWWYHEGNRALRVGDWKLVTDHQKPWELYDLRTDRSETHNLATQNSDRVKEMERLWNTRLEEFSTLVKKDLPPGEPAKKQKKKKAATK